MHQLVKCPGMHWKVWKGNVISPNAHPSSSIGIAPEATQAEGTEPMSPTQLTSKDSPEGFHSTRSAARMLS